MTIDVDRQTLADSFHDALIDRRSASISTAVSRLWNTIRTQSMTRATSGTGG